MTVAFEDLEALHKAKGDWKALAHSYRRMIKRLPTDAPHAFRLSLWTRLGDIAIKRLHDRKLALAAFEAAAALEPGDVDPAGDAGPPLRAVGPGHARAGDRRRTSGCSRAIRTAPIRTARSPSCTATATSSTSSGASPRRSTT